ncbi:hypothetical protein CONPUDRAFT_26075, partial [Coniophora puteana RWD-64-598 SS2]
LSTCGCQTAPLQLVRLGMFPNTPSKPTLAIDFRVLSLASNLFKRLTPNSTAWCEALDDFFKQMRYQFATDDPLRRWFAMAIHWFAVLRLAVESHVDRVIECAQPARMSTPVAGTSSEDAVPLDTSPVIASHSYSRTQVSPYLQSRCALCFPETFSHSTSSPDVIVCLDACFTQKRANNTRQAAGEDPPNPTASFFVPECVVKEIQEWVAQQREPRTGTRGRQHEDDDNIEAGMKVPASSLEACGSSFKAADETREKASTCFFADTGLMALVCRHDRVLWFCNMTSAGERQYYALALLEMLLRHVPGTTRVGLLYDIACQLERSARKWGLLSDEVLARMEFGVSVFHAYGHQWPCQVVYHPCKRIGFGLSDGEGCERLWSALRFLISILRVSGMHQRRFVLDDQVRFLDAKAMISSGTWLRNKWKGCQEKKTVALDVLRECATPVGVLRGEWNSQVLSQTRPYPVRAYLARVDAAVARALELEKTMNARGTQVTHLEQQLRAGLNSDVLDIGVMLKDARESHKLAIAALQQCLGTMGAPARRRLQQRKLDVYMQVRIEALSALTRIRERARGRKFQLERMKDSYRSSANVPAENHLMTHIESSVKRGEPSLKRLVDRYNQLCMDIRSLISKRRAPARAVVPPLITAQQVFNLDVDNDIWQNTGLDDSSLAPPAWLSNDSVRRGIRAMLEVDRCNEEEARLLVERCRLQDWIKEQWQHLKRAEAGTGANEVYFITRRKEHVARLYTEWEPLVRDIPCDEGSSWGLDPGEVRD